MPVPKSVVKFKKGTVEYTSSVDRINYTMQELTRAALRDTGKYICMQFRRGYYSTHKRRKGKVGKFTQYWVRKRDGNLQVGVKPNAFYGMFQEFGTSKEPRLNLLTKAAQDNIETIRTIQSQYLSAIEDEQKAMALIDEGEYQGE